MTPTRPSAFPSFMLTWVVLDTLAALLWLAIAVFVYSNAGELAIVSLALVLSGLALAGSWSLRTLLVLFRRISGRRDRLSWGALALWLLMPLFGLVGAACAVTDYDLRLRVRLSATELTPQAAAARNGAPTKTGWIGLFEVDQILLLDDGTVRFTTTPAGVIGFDEAGLYHTTVPNPVRLREGGSDELRDLYGPWRAFYYHE